MMRLIFSLFLLAQSPAAFSCSCDDYVDDFCYSADSSDYIALVKLVSFDDEPEGYYYSGANFVLIENINKEIPDTLSILGQDGLNCALSLNQFNIGDTLVINAWYSSGSFESASNFNVYDWTIGGCTRNYLQYSNGVVIGNTYTGSDVLDYEFFKANIGECFDFTVSTENTIDNSIAIYPNPFIDQLLITSEKQKITALKIYDLTGHIIHSQNQLLGSQYAVDLSNQSKGVYIVELHTSAGILRRKLLKIN